MADIDIFDLYATISIKADDFERGIEQAQKKLETFGKNVKSFSSDISNVSSSIKKAYDNVGDALKPAIDGFKAVEDVGKKAGNAVLSGLKGFAAISTAVAGFGAAAVKSGMNFDATMSKVSAISGATGDDFYALRNKAIDMGEATQFSATDAAEAMTYMGMAGWKTQDMLDGIAGIMNLAAASGEDLATTSDIVTDALTAFGMSASDSGRFADILAAASTNANTNVGMMGETFKYVAPLAGTLGYSAEDTAIAIGLMANSGIKGSQAGTALRSALSNLVSPAKTAADAMIELGLITGEGFKIATQNADGSAKSLSETIGILRDTFSGLTETQQASYAAQIFGKEAMSGMLAIINASTEDYGKLAAAIYDCNGAAEEMAKIRLDNLAGDITYLQSAFGTLQIVISDALNGGLREFVQFGTNSVKALTEGFKGSGVSGFMSALSGIVTDGVTMLAQKAPEFASVSLQFIGALADGFLGASYEIMIAASGIFNTLMDGAESWLSQNSGKLSDIGIDIIELIFSMFVQADNLIRDNIGQFVTLMATAFFDYHSAIFGIGMDILGAIGQGIVENKGEIQGLASQAITEMVIAIRDNAPMIIDGGLALLEALVGAITENLPLIVATGAEIIGRLVTGIATASPAVQAIIGTAVLPHILKIIETVTSIGSAVSSVAGLVGGAIQTIIGIGGKLMTGVQALWGLISAHPVIAVVTAIIAAVVLLWNNCEAFRDAVKSIWDAIVGFFQAAADLIKAAFDGVVDFFSGIWEGIQNIFTGVAEFFGGIFQSAADLVRAAWDAIVSFFQSVWDGIQTIFSVVADVLGGFFQAAVEAVQSAWGAVVDFFGGIWDGIQEIFSVVADVLGGLFQAAVEAVKAAWEVIVDFFSAIWEGIQNVFSRVVEVLGGFFSTAVDVVKRSWETVIEFFAGVWQGIQDVFSNVSEVLGGAFQAAWELVSGAWDVATGFFFDIWNNIREKGAETASKVGEALKSAWDGVKKAWDNATSFFSGVWDDIKGVFSDAWDKFSAIGGNIVDGIRNGISNAWKNLTSWVSGLFGDLISSVKSKLGIHSPSTVFASIGGNMALGVGEGWASEYSGIKAMIQNGLDFGTATVGLSANVASSGGNAYNQGSALQSNGAGTVNNYNFTFNSPKEQDPVTASRKAKRAAQLMALES